MHGEPYVCVRALDVLGRVGGRNSSVPQQNLDMMDMFNFSERLELCATAEIRRWVRFYLDGAVHKSEDIWLCAGLPEVRSSLDVEEGQETCDVKSRNT